LEESRTTIYQKNSSVTYQLKMKTARSVFSEVQKKAGAFPINIRVLEEEKKARLGLQEAVQHGLVKPYEVMYVQVFVLARPLSPDPIRIRYTPPNTFVAGFHFTIALLPAGPLLLTHPPLWYKPELVKTDKELDDEELKELSKKPLRERKVKKKKAVAEGDLHEA
jgi:hypothetical protein